MATPLEVIYSKFLNKIDDVELSLVEDGELEELLFDYLENATLEFFECEKDLTVFPKIQEELLLNCSKNPSAIDFGVREIIPELSIDEEIDKEFSQDVFYSWEVDIPDREFNKIELYYLQEVIDPSFSYGEDSTDGDIIDGIKYERVLLEEGTHYVIKKDEKDNKAKIYSIFEFSEADYLYYTYNSKGYIASDLDLDEIHILAYGMLMSWISPKIRREENLRQMMNDRDFKQLSNANMVAKLLDLSKHTRSELTRYKQRYAYKSFKGFN